VGRTEPIRVYEPMFKDDCEVRAGSLKTFAEALQKFYSGDFKDALELFKIIKDEDPAARAYAEKCLTLINEPPEHWHGVWVMSEK